MSDALIGYLLALASLCSFAMSILVTRLASPHLSLALGFVVSTTVNVLVALVLVLLQQLWHAHPIGWHAQAFWLFAAAGVCATFLGRWLFYESVERFGPERTSVFQIGIPVFTAALAWLLFDERLSPLALLGMAIAVTGLLIVGHKRGSNAPRSPSGQFSLVHSLLVLGFGSSAAYASGNLNRGYAVREWPETVIGSLVGAVGGLVLHVAVTPGKLDLLAQLAGSQAPVERALDAQAALALDLKPVQFDEPGFRLALNQDAMATEKLAEGIRAFVADAVSLEQLVLAV
jgi:drug/metabolite transporter (DMT)-like permease